MAAMQSSISPSSRHAQNPRSQPCSPSNSSFPIIKSPDASCGCRLSSIWKSSSSPVIRHLLFQDIPTYYAPTTRKFLPRRDTGSAVFNCESGKGYVMDDSKFDIHDSIVVSQEIQHDPVELFWPFHVRHVCRAVHDDLAHVW